MPDEKEEDVIIGQIEGKPFTKGHQFVLKLVKNFYLMNTDEVEKEIYSVYDLFCVWIRYLLEDEIHSFRMEQDLVGLLLKSDTKIKYMPCPFRTIFIDADLQLNENVGLYGLFIRDEHKTLIFGGMIKIKRKKDNQFVMIPYVNKIDKEFLDEYYSEVVKRLLPKDFQNTIANFVCCFIHFLDYPEKEIINYLHKEKSKQDIPRKISYKDNFIRLTGLTKVYIENLRKQLDGKIDWTHSFWVRGHFMHLKAERYKENKGKTIWRKPFIKGKGVLVKKEYLVKKHDTSLH